MRLESTLVGITVSAEKPAMEHHAQKFRRISPDLSVDLKSDDELIDHRSASIRKQVEILKRWE
jgi:hypothetical protein